MRWATVEGGKVRMAVLTSKQRDRLAPNQFALSDGRYPINDVKHARDALSRAAAEHNAGKLSDSDYNQVKRKANHFLDAHEGKDRHSDGVKS